MEQDGNTAMPKSPDFSSQNNPVNPPAGAITSAIDQSSSQEIAAAAAALPENDRPAITSSPSTSTSHIFGRHFKPQASRTQQVAPSATFAGAPDFFNEAAAKNSDYITIGQDPATNSNKKRFIIIGVLVALIAVVGVVALVAPKVVNDIQVANSTKDLIPSFNKFANYLIDGSESTENISDDIEIDKYTAHKIDYMSESEDEEQKKQYFEKLLGYYDDFEENLDNIDDDKYDIDLLDEKVEYIRDAVEFMSDVTSISKKTDFDIASYYVSNGKDKTEAYIENKFSDYIDSDNSVIANYSEKKKAYYSDYLEMIDYASRTTEDAPLCDSADGSCQVSAEYNAYKDAMARMSEDENELFSYSVILGRTIKEQVIDISKTFYGENGDEAE